MIKKNRYNYTKVMNNDLESQGLHEVNVQTDLEGPASPVSINSNRNDSTRMLNDKKGVASDCNCSLLQLKTETSPTKQISLTESKVKVNSFRRMNESSTKAEVRRVDKKSMMLMKPLRTRASPRGVNIEMFNNGNDDYAIDTE